jgi:starch-binding outer membrane protein, SusD/RagB family
LIYKERQLELAVEGQTWFDWLRTGRLQQIVEMQNTPNRVYRESAELLPIPMLEITLSKGVLEQNFGY